MPRIFAPSRHLLVLCLAAIAALFLITCGGDSTTTPEDDGGGGDVPRTLTIALDAASGTPGSRITVTGIPDDVDWAYGLVTVAGAVATSGPEGAATQADPAVTMIRRTDAGDELVIPVHPVTPMQGGAVEIEVTNGTNITSNRVTLDIDALTPAPGEFDAVVTKLEALLDGWAGQAGTTPEAMRSVTADQLSAIELPIYLMHVAINHPDHPNSLRAFADGDIPLEEGDPVDRDLLDAITALSGLSGFLDEKNAFVDTLTAPAASIEFVTRAMRRGPGQFDCVEAPTFDIGSEDCQKLSEVMAYQAELRLEKQGAVQKIQDDALDALASALSYARGAQIAWGVLNTLWAANNIEAASTGLYPSSFISDQTDFTADPEVFPEDFTTPGKWSEFRVSATSEGWRFDDVLKDAFDKAKGLSDSGWDDEQLQDFFEKAQDKTYTDYVKKVEDGLKDSAYDNAKQELNIDDLTKLEYCTQTWEGIDCTGLPYSEGSSPALDVDSEAETYEPSEVGSTTLEIKTTDEFGLVTPTAETKTIETRRIEVTVDPFQAIAEVGQTIVFTATVMNAENEAVDWYTEGSLPGDFQPNGNQCTIVTPNAPWNPAIVLKARSKAETGLRVNVVNSDPREGEAAISNGEQLIIVTPVGECVKPGETETFTATIVGAQDQSVTWSTDPPNTGTFSGNVYTAPNNNAGTVVIIATSVANPGTKGYASVRVAGCECWWTAVIAGDRQFFWSGTNSAWGDQGGIASFIFETQVSGPGIHYPVINALVFATVGSGATGTWDMTGTVTLDADNFWSPGDPDNEGGELPQLTITSNDGQTIEGTASGTFFRPIQNSNPVQFEVLSLNLRFKATDGALALCQD